MVCFYILINKISDKFSTTAKDVKIEALKTIRAVVKSYSRGTINCYLIALINLILNEVLNNDEELLHIDSLITFKDLVKKFYYKDSPLEYIGEIKNSENEKDSAFEEDIEKNIYKVFEKCEGLIFNSETVKSSYDAKDILVIITEYNAQLRLSALKISIKLVSHFLNDNKSHYLKNSNTILFYSLKNFNLEKAEKMFLLESNDINKKNNNNSSDNVTMNINTEEKSISENAPIKNNKNTFQEESSSLEIFEYFNSNGAIFKNLFYTLLKRDFSSNATAQEIVYICELISNFLIKTEKFIFSEQEIKNIFEFIFNIWKSADEDTENSLATCIVALTSKFDFLENYKSINLFFQTKIDYLLILLKNSHVRNDNKNTIHSNKHFNYADFNFKEITKYLNLFIKLFTIEKISNYVLKEYFTVYIKVKKNLINFYKKLNKNIYSEIALSTYNTGYNITLPKQICDDEMIDIGEAHLNNLKLQEEDKVYNLIILIFQHITKNILKIINENIYIINLKKNGTDNIDNQSSGGCCGGGRNSKKSKSNGCCQDKGKKKQTSGCCSKKNQCGEDSSDNDDKLINESNQSTTVKKVCKKEQCKNYLNRTEEELVKEKINSENSNILFTGILNVLLISHIPDNENNNHNQIQSDLEINEFFEVHDKEIFKSSLELVENYLSSSFIDSEKYLKFYQTLVNILKGLKNKFDLFPFNSSGRSDLQNIINYFFIFFSSKNNLNNNNSFTKDKEFIFFFKKLHNIFYLKYFLKINKLLLNAQITENEEDSSYLANISYKAPKTLLDLESIDLLNAISDNIKVLINENISQIYFGGENKNYKLANKEYLNIIHMLSLDSNLKNKYNDSYNINKTNETKNQKDNKFTDASKNANSKALHNLTESEKENLLIFQFKDFQEDKLFSFSNTQLNQSKMNFDFNLYSTLLFFTNLNKQIYKLSGFYYFLLYDSLNKHCKISSSEDKNDVNNCTNVNNYENKMDIEGSEDSSINNNSNTNNKNHIDTVDLISKKLKLTYDRFLQSFENILNINKKFTNLIINNLDIDEKESILNFQTLDKIDELNKFNSYLNYLCLINDKNVFEIINKFFEKIFKICANKNDLESYINKNFNLDPKCFVDPANLSMVYLYFEMVFFLNIVINNVNFDNLNNPYVTIPIELSRYKIKINFLKFNKKLYQKHFDHNGIDQYMLLFKKNSEFGFMHIEKNDNNQFMESNESLGSSDTNAKTSTENLLLYLKNKNSNADEISNSLKFHKAFINSMTFLETDFYKFILANFILNFYLNFSFENLQDNIDIILDHTLKFLSEGICIEKSAKSLKNIIQYIGKNFLQKKGYNLFTILENLMKVKITILIFRF